MILLKTNQLNKMVVTVSQNAELSNPEWLFSFTHIFSKERVTMILPNISTHKVRYDEFEFIEGRNLALGEIAFPYEGQYNYAIWEQPMGSGNLDPALAYNKVEAGLALLIATSGNTTNDYYMEYISNDEFDSNIIFAPDELNPVPTPNVTPTLTTTSTPTPSVTPTITQTPTNTPSETPTNTPTNTGTPAVTPSVTPSETPTNTPTPTTTLTATPSETPTSTPSETPTNTPSVTPTNTPSETPTNTPTQTNTPSVTQTATPSETPTNTPTLTPTNTETPTPTTTPTNTPTPSITASPTNTPTPSITPSVTQTNTPTVTTTSSPTPTLSPAALDPDASAFLSTVIASGGTLNATISAATDTLYTSLKSAGLYNKIHAFYPYIGGVQGSCRLEGKLQSAYYITYVGGFTFNASGATPNGTNGYAFNNFIANGTINANSCSWFTYLGGIATTAYVTDFGTGSYLTPNFWGGLIGGPGLGDPNYYFYCFGNNSARATVVLAAINSQVGFFGSNRSASNVHTAWYNGIKKNTNTNVSADGPPSNSIHMPYPAGDGGGYASRRHQMDIIAEGLTDSEVLTLSNIINTFQTSLGRNVY